MAQSMSDSAVRFSSSPRFIDPQVLFSIRNLPLIAQKCGGRILLGSSPLTLFRLQSGFRPNTAPTRREMT